MRETPKEPTKEAGIRDMPIWILAVNAFLSPFGAGWIAGAEYGLGDKHWSGFVLRFVFTVAGVLCIWGLRGRR
jgi:hypothetical protein